MQGSLMIEAIFSLLLVLVELLVSAVVALANLLGGVAAGAGAALGLGEALLLLGVVLLELVLWLLSVLWMLLLALLRWRKPRRVARPRLWRPRPRPADVMKDKPDAPGV